MQACLLAVCVLAFGPAGAETPSTPDERTACALEPGPTRAVARVIDAETFALDDGSEVRLIGALAPRPPDSALDLSFWPPEREAKAALERLIVGRSVTLAYSGRRSDRYGRTLAQVFIEPDDPADAAAEKVWVQARLLSDGHARAFVVKDNTGCLRELAAHEAVARRASAGLWRHAAYQVRDAGRAQDLMRLRSTFQIVEGEGTDVLQTKTALILRFGAERALERNRPAGSDDADAPSRGFSIAVKANIAHAWRQADMTLEQTLGQRLRIRGWIERRVGPAIEILDPHQIERVDDPALAPVAEETPPPRRRRSRRGSRESAALLAPQ